MYYWIALLFVSANDAFLRLVESASARLTKQCFSTGEEINVRFSEVSGQGVFIGLYPSADVQQQTLPEITSPSLKKWILTCGNRDNCDQWPSRGLVHLSTDSLSEGDYIIAVSGDRSGRTPQALTRVFQVGGECSISSFFGAVPVGSPTIMFGPTISSPVPLPSSLTLPLVSVPKPVPVPVQSPQGTSFMVGGGIQSIVDDARFQIENLIRRDGDLTGKVSLS